MKNLRICLMVIAGLLVTAGVQAKKKDIISQEKGKSITFRVDTDLPEPTGESLKLKMKDKQALISAFLNEAEVPGDAERVVGFGLGDERYAYYGEDPFFKGMIDAFADHRPVVLSPDVIWFLICQGFAHYVNDNPEEVRNLFVDHVAHLAVL